MDLPIIAGTISTVLFMSSTLPMLHKAFRSKDLRSYSFGNMLLSNSGNAVHSLYVYSLPPGPIWWLHSFHLVTTGLMLAWYLRYERRAGIRLRLRSRFNSLGRSVPGAIGHIEDIRNAPVRMVDGPVDGSLTRRP